ncbi:PDX1 [Candida pseudojiufengensis]|uniref:PDX1 n=1 Tax=Candida pseudojiufengensis TaxID=497109 RepID=UPI0022242494|nr:PDX1 [Candida pseudojiufengensis]KAI5962306.1 PDX1 [Candida pseudojiufengensis]
MLRVSSLLKNSSSLKCIPKLASKQYFSNSSINNEASIFKMPAMSPTMTEGKIISWKLKPGDSFNSGDVLLEVETDKASIDVEAADDGKIWEILEQDGASGIPVGKPIAFLAEVDDDLNSLEKPKVEESKEEPKKEEPKKEEPKKETKKEEPKKEPKKETKKSESKPTDSSSILQKANPNQKFSPSVELLLHENHISKEDALNKIQATGPSGRILKGDVLAYLGTINTDSVVNIAKFIKSREHLDLSNITIAKTDTKTGSKDTPTTKPQEKPKPKNILNVELTSTISDDISPQNFKNSFKNIIKSSIQQTYSSKFPQFANSPTASSIYDNYDIFEELITPSVTKNRFEISDIKFKFYNQQPPRTKQIVVDEFDEILVNNSIKNEISTQYLEIGSSNVLISFKIKFNDQLLDSKQFVSNFEEILISQIPTNKLKITN